MDFEIDDLSLTQQAVRLVYKGLQPRATATTDREYARLIRKWDASPDFRKAVRDHAAMLDLVVVEVTAKQILLRPSGTESMFRMRLADIRGRNPKDNALFGVALVAIAAAFFRTGADLADAPGRTTVEDLRLDALGRSGRPATVQLTAEQIDDVLSQILNRVAAAEQGSDPVSGDENAESVWRALRTLSRTAEGEAKSGWGNRASILQKCLAMLVEHNMLKRDDAGERPSYVATTRFREQMRDVLTTDVYQKCIRLLGSDEAAEREKTEC